MKHTITFRHEAKITADGKKRNGNKKPMIAIDLHKTFNSCEDFMETYHVCKNSLYRALYPDGEREIYIKVFRLDENGKKVCIGKTRVSFVAHSESVVGKLVDNGREIDEKLSRERELNSQLQSENADLRKELSKANAVIYGLRNENEALRKENERIAELERKAALWDAYEEHQAAKRKAREAIENYKRMEQEAIALRQESEKELAELMKGDAYVA